MGLLDLSRQAEAPKAMTRRHFADLTLTALAGTVACAPSKTGIIARLNETALSRNFAIVDTLVPEAMTVIGAGTGRLALSERPGRLSLAPDGAWVAWFPYDSNVYPESTKGARVYFTDNPRSAKTVKLTGLLGAQLAISSGAEHLAVAVVVSGGPVTRLLVVRPATGEVKQDLTDLITQFSLGQLERLRLSASGDRLVAGSRNLFSVLDVPSRKVLFEGQGRFPSISPSGKDIAFVDRHRKLSLTTITTGATRRLLGRSATHGVGAWTPDGSLLLAGVEPTLSFFWYLSAVDCSGDAYAEIERLEEHDSGQECALINRRLLTPDPV
jgi:hypothetical protein